ncbi:MAG: Sugar-specific transcriptional regulator TrmB [Parcubacteria bacterium OLB19]|nr:MAG: Sugar-specific transcriptional regulator TrmB [Parcubacteria bacterium OLB19]
MKNFEKLLVILNKIGLTDNESRVYLASLQLGPAKVAQLSRISNVKRTTIYPIVESLHRKGLIFEKEVGLKKIFCSRKSRSFGKHTRGKKQGV